MLIMSVFDSDLTALEINRHAHSTSTNKFVALMPFFPKKIGCSIVTTKASSHDRYCPLGVR